MKENQFNYKAGAESTFIKASFVETAEIGKSHISHIITSKFALERIRINIV